MPVDVAVEAAAKRWISIDPDAKTRGAVEAMLAAGDEAALRGILLSGRMEFGTAGLRAAMGPGYNRMNQVTIAQSAQGFVKYLTQQFDAATLANRGIVVGYDARHNSQRFAQITANVCVECGVKCRLTSAVVPTPYVAYGLRLFNAVAAVVVTASHNPKADNGYKVYWANGAQIIPPHDTGIAACIEQSLDIRAAAFGDGYKSPAVECPKAEVEKQFFSTLAPMCARHKAAVASTDLKFTYSAMHGVGGEPVLKACAEAGLDPARLIIVKEQFQPDPEFPTVAFPNPEEGKAALDLSIAAANAAGSTLIFANDPDADRLAIAEKDPETGAWQVLTGNELGTLLGWWMLQEAIADGVDLSKCVMLASTVSSQILGAYAKKHGFQFVDTLTGFKWMGSVGGAAEDNDGKQMLFAFEQAIGFMCGNRVRDKDGVTALAVGLQMASVLAAQKHTLRSQLQAIYAEFGAHICVESYVVSSSPAKTLQMFDSISRDGNYPSSIGGIAVTGVRDLRTGLDTRQPDQRAVLPISTAPMVTFYMEGGAVLTIRGSGTEPKIKWYCEAVGDSVEQGKALVGSIVSGAIAEILKPEEFGFARRPGE